MAETADSDQPDVAGFLPQVVAGLIPALPIIIPLCLPIRVARPKVDDDSDSLFKAIDTRFSLT